MKKFYNLGACENNEFSTEIMPNYDFIVIKNKIKLKLSLNK